MNTGIKKHIVIVLGILIFSSISCNESVVEPQFSENLIANGNFEINNQPSLEGWGFGNPKLAEPVNKGAPNNGNWSLQLTSDWAPTTGFAYTPVTNLKAGDIVVLSAYVRGYGRYGGRGIIGLLDGDSAKSVSSGYDTVWTQISITDTLTLAKTDTIWVFLSSPSTEIIPYQQLFDDVRLEKILK